MGKSGVELGLHIRTRIWKIRVIWQISLTLKSPKKSLDRVVHQLSDSFLMTRFYEVAPMVEVDENHVNKRESCADE